MKDIEPKECTRAMARVLRGIHYTFDEEEALGEINVAIDLWLEMIGKYNG